MFDLATSPSGDVLTHVRLFFAVLGAEVVGSAGTLGGPRAEARALRLLVSVRNGTPSLGHLRRELDWLWGLLTLANVHDPGSVEAACLACLKPGSDEVAGLCSLAEELGALFDRIGAPKDLPA